jgi:hypothetical protein
MESSILEAWIENDEIDRVIHAVSDSEIAEAWLRYHRTNDDDAWWAVALWLSEGWWRHEDLVRRGIIRLIELAKSQYELSIIGASILEMFASDNESDLRWIEARARASERFRYALSTAYALAVSHDSMERIVRAIQGNV